VILRPLRSGWRREVDHGRHWPRRFELDGHRQGWTARRRIALTPAENPFTRDATGAGPCARAHLDSVDLHGGCRNRAQTSRVPLDQATSPARPDADVARHLVEIGYHHRVVCAAGSRG
jgi:hypothetical protein